jgi:hypothetical protein
MPAMMITIRPRHSTSSVIAPRLWDSSSAQDPNLPFAAAGGDEAPHAEALDPPLKGAGPLNGGLMRSGAATMHAPPRPAGAHEPRPPPRRRDAPATPVATAPSVPDTFWC